MSVREALRLLRGIAVAVIAVIALAAIGQHQPSRSHDDIQRDVRPATEVERLKHDLHQAWELDQLDR